MVIEVVGTMLSGLTLLFDRIDRAPDAKAQIPDLREALLDLDGWLDEWIVAAEATNSLILEEALRKPTVFRDALLDQGSRAAMVVRRAERDGNKLQLNIAGDANASARLSRLFEIYAPELARELQSLVESRYLWLNSMFDQNARSVVDALKANRELPDEVRRDLERSVADLLRAQEQLRGFIRSSFPITS
jgi:hypothetical protein